MSARARQNRRRGVRIRIVGAFNQKRYHLPQEVFFEVRPNLRRRIVMNIAFPLRLAVLGSLMVLPAGGLQTVSNSAGKSTATGPRIYRAKPTAKVRPTNSCFRAAVKDGNFHGQHGEPNGQRGLPGDRRQDRGRRLAPSWPPRAPSSGPRGHGVFAR